MRKLQKTSDQSNLVYSTASGDVRKLQPKSPSSAAASTKTAQALTVRLETGGRRGKAVTLISGIDHNPQKILELAKTLRSHCGAGGTVEGKDILVQGDQRDKVTARLESLGYKVRKQ